MEREIIGIVERVSTAIEGFLIKEKFPVNQYLKFNIFLIVFMVERMQLTNMKLLELKILDYEELHIKFADLVIKNFKNLDLSENILSTYIPYKVSIEKADANGLFYKNAVETFIAHKGLFINDLYGYLSTLESEFKNVITSVKNYENRRKVELPNEAFSSLFSYPTIFLNEYENRSTKLHLFKDNEMDCMEFIRTYVNMTNNIQQFLKIENMRFFFP